MVINFRVCIMPLKTISTALFIISPVSNTKTEAPQILFLYWLHSVYKVFFFTCLKYSCQSERKVCDYFYPELLLTNNTTNNAKFIKTRNISVETIISYKRSTPQPLLAKTGTIIIITPTISSVNYVTNIVKNSTTVIVNTPL
jgi:hypothetical protein